MDRDLSLLQQVFPNQKALDYHYQNLRYYDLTPRSLFGEPSPSPYFFSFFYCSLLLDS